MYFLSHDVLFDIMTCCFDVITYLDVVTYFVMLPPTVLRPDVLLDVVMFNIPFDVKTHFWNI